MQLTQPTLEVVLGSAYWPSLHYFWYIVQAEKIVIDGHEHFEKQSYRNRCKILSANGPLSLSIPVVHPGNRCETKQVALSDAPWKAQHLAALKSAYGKAPYFTFFYEEIEALYRQAGSSLFEFNKQQLSLLLKIFRLKKDIQYAEAYVECSEAIDLRQLIHPKTSFMQDERVMRSLQKTYYQGFATKFGFTPDLSVLDILFNTGLETLPYLRTD